MVVASKEDNLTTELAAGPDGSGQIEHRVGGQPVLDHIVGTAGVGQFGFGVARFGPRD